MVKVKGTRLQASVVIALSLALGTAAYAYNLYQHGKAFEFLSVKQKPAPSLVEPRADASDSNSSTPNAANTNSATDNQTIPTVLIIRGKYEHLNETQQRLASEWGVKAYTLALLHPRQIILNGRTNRKAVSLTFDDGPDGTITPQILDILKAYDVKATFCYVGTQMQYFPEVVKQTAELGNEIINHTFEHPQMSQLKPEAMKTEVAQNDSLISELTGNQPKSVRPPYGDINAVVVDEMRKEGKTIVLWSLDSLDWADDPPDVLVSNVLDNVRPGDIILMHSLSTRTNTTAALPMIIQGLKDQEYSIIRVDQLTGRNL